MTSKKNSRRSCPCQHTPLSLSSATAAEYGDIESLSHRLVEKRTNAHSHPEQHVITNGGITPLHLAAQHDHPAAVSLLLSKGGCHVDTGLTSDDRSSYCGATPLHRASFAGSVSAMEVLLEWGSEQSSAISTDILAKDESFGDLRTPLHKAVAGGRPLAVQLLLMFLRQKNLLADALNAVDSQGLTAMQLAQQFTSLETEELEREKCSVRRWDSIAGGPADWTSCLSLLESAATPSSIQELTSHKAAISTLTSFEKKLPLFCADDEECGDGICRTAAWERAFRSALATSLQSSLALSKPTIENENRSGHISTTLVEPNKCKDKENHMILQDRQDASLKYEHKAQVGRICDKCREQVITLFRFNGKLVCRECKRTQRAPSSNNMFGH
jgi:ankyrin repeat protein